MSGTIIQFGITNSIFVYKDLLWKVALLDFFASKVSVYDLEVASTNLRELFPDRQKNLNGFEYNVVLVKQFPKIRRIVSSNDVNIEGIDVAVFTEIVKHQNASWKITLIGDTNSMSNNTQAGLGEFQWFLNTKFASLTLNTAIHAPGHSYRSMINTYDIAAYCALVPVPPRVSFLRFLLTPYDLPSWLALGTAIFVCALLWLFLHKRYKNSRSAWIFLFGIAANFFGQSLSFGMTSRTQKIILYLCILATFIMGNAYQGKIISLMSKSRDGKRFQTFGELFRSKFILRTDEIFRRHLTELGYNQIKGKVSTEIFQLFRSEIWDSTDSALIYRCEAIDTLFKNEAGYVNYDNYYILPETLIPSFETFLLGARSPFYEKIQKYFNVFFESGIRKHYKSLFERKNENALKSAALFISTEKYLLNLDDLFGVFLMLTSGIVVGLMVFIIEIFLEGIKKLRSSKCCFKNTLLKALNKSRPRVSQNK